MASRGFADNYQPPSGCKVTTTAGSDISTEKTFNGIKKTPQFGIVCFGSTSGDLVLKWYDDNTDVTIPVEPGSYIGGGCYSIDATSDNDIIVAWYY